MQLFIANCTKQHIEFLYRVPGESRANPYRIEIPVGQCAKVHRDDTSDVIDAIIAQHADYGLIAVNEIDRRRDFIGMCYSVDKPIDVNNIITALKHNNEVLEERGAEQRKHVAVAISDSASRQAQEVGGSVNGLSVSVEEVAIPGGKEIQVNETIEVVNKPGKKAKK